MPQGQYIREKGEGEKWLNHPIYISLFLLTRPSGRLRLAAAVTLVIWVGGTVGAFIDNIPFTQVLTHSPNDNNNNNSMALSYHSLSLSLLVGPPSLNEQIADVLLVYHSPWISDDDSTPPNSNKQTNKQTTNERTNRR